jgi:hypothetical protein
MKMKMVGNIKEVELMISQMRDRANLAAGYLNRVVYPQILQLQLNRWRTEGASETGQWAPINPKYAQYKIRKFAAYPGGGRHLLIATGRLVDSMTKPSSRDHFKLVTNSRLEVGTKVDYASFVDEKRAIASLSKSTRDEFVRGFVRYVATGRDR